MFGNFAPTPYDLQFEVLRIPVRVHPIFWISSVWLCWAPNDLLVTTVGVLCLFFGVLIHEMGHALVTRRFGWQPEIVLHMLGGYATSMRHSTWKDIAVSAAGPAAGFLLVLAIWVTCEVLGIFADSSSLFRPVFDPHAMLDWPATIRTGTRGNELILAAIQYSLFFNLLVNLINLIPVLPLDGGQISREYWLWAKPREGMQICLKLGVGAGGAVALWALYSMSQRGSPWSVGYVLRVDPLFLGIMFGYLAYLSYEQLQQAGGRRW